MSAYKAGKAFTIYHHALLNTLVMGPESACMAYWNDYKASLETGKIGTDGLYRPFKPKEKGIKDQINRFLTWQKEPDFAQYKKKEK